MRTSPCLCPKCHGQRYVSMPPWVPGDVYSWVANDTQVYPCSLCDGFGYIQSLGAPQTGDRTAVRGET